MVTAESQLTTVAALTKPPMVFKVDRFTFDTTTIQKLENLLHLQKAALMFFFC